MQPHGCNHAVQLHLDGLGLTTLSTVSLLYFFFLFLSLFLYSLLDRYLFVDHKDHPGARGSAVVLLG